METEDTSVPERTKKRGGRVSRWLESRAQRVVKKAYQAQADDIEKRARRAVGSAYKDQADDLEDRAIRALRGAIADEADRIKEAIEHGVQVKKREVRLSLLVLVVASVVYLLLYWFTTHGDTPAE